jgi:hypothetical protein
MKHTMTNLEAANECSSSKFPILGNYVLDFYFGNFIVETFVILESQQSKLSLQEDKLCEIDCNISIVDNVTLIHTIDNVNKSNFRNMSYIWNSFYGSKSQEGVGASCPFIYPWGEHRFISFRL